MTLKDFIDGGELEGYKPGTPPPGPFGGPDIDASICAQATCSECGHQGMEFHPYVAPGSYRAFAVCPQCGDAQEF